MFHFPPIKKALLLSILTAGIVLASFSFLRDSDDIGGPEQVSGLVPIALLQTQVIPIIEKTRDGEKLVATIPVPASDPSQTSLIDQSQQVPTITPTPDIGQTETRTPFLTPTPLSAPAPSTINESDKSSPSPTPESPDNYSEFSATPSPSTIPSPTPTPLPSVMFTSTPTPAPSPTPTPLASTAPIASPQNILPVVINEIAWMGTDANWRDEWIELYNPNDILVDISGWKLVSEDASPNITFFEETLLDANGYFLIERTDDSTVSTISADLVSSFGKGGLVNGGEALQLIDRDGNIIDVAGSADGAWFAGNNKEKRTMERISSSISGDKASNWKTNDSPSGALDADSGIIKGTPRWQNSVMNVI